MISNEEVSNKSSAQADGTANEYLDDLVSNSFKPVESENDSCFEIHDQLVILSTKNVDDTEDVFVTFTVGKYPNAKKYTENIKDLLEDIREDRESYDFGVGQAFVEANSAHTRKLRHNYHYPFGNDVNASTFTLATAINNQLVIPNPTGKPSISTVDCANYILEHLNIIIIRESLVMYVYSSGVYVKGGEEYVKEAIRELLETEWTLHYEKEILGNIRGIEKVSSKEFLDDSYIVNVENGLVNIKTGEWSHHDPKKHYLSQYPFAYDPSAKNEFFDRELFKQCIPISSHLTLQEKEAEAKLKKDCIYEGFGWVLEPGNKRKKCFILYGPHDTIKSVIGIGLQRFVGEGSYSVKKLSQLCSGDKFAIGSLHGSKLNVSGELNKKAIANMDMFKALTGGNTLDCEKKGKDSFPLQNRAKQFVETNELPAMGDTDEDSFFSRLLIIPIEQTIPREKQDPNIADKFYTKEGLSGIFNEALLGYSRIMADGAKFSYEKSIDEIADIYAKSTNSWEEYLKAEYTILYPTIHEEWRIDNPGENEYSVCSEVVDGYIKWCPKNNAIATKKRGYKAEVQRVTNGIVFVKQLREEGNKECFMYLVKKKEKPQKIITEDFTKPKEVSVAEMYDAVAYHMNKGPVTMDGLVLTDSVTYSYAKKLIESKILRENPNTHRLEWTA